MLLEVGAQGSRIWVQVPRTRKDVPLPQIGLGTTRLYPPPPQSGGSKGVKVSCLSGLRYFMLLNHEMAYLERVGSGTKALGGISPAITGVHAGI